MVMNLWDGHAAALLGCPAVNAPHPEAGNPNDERSGRDPGWAASLIRSVDVLAALIASPSIGAAVRAAAAEEARNR